MIENISKSIENILGSNEDENEMVLQLKQLISLYELNNFPKKKSNSISELFTANVQELQSSKQKLTLIKSGFRDLDTKIGGFTPGELIIIGGISSYINSQFLINLSINIAKTTPVLYFTFDLTTDILTNRFLSTLTNIPINKINQNELSDIEKNNLSEITEKKGELKLYINDSCKNSISDFEELCLDYIHNKGVKVIFIDCLERMGSDKFRSSREKEINSISRALKKIAINNNVCIISTSEISGGAARKASHRIPRLKDLTGYPSIINEADKVFIFYNSYYFGFEEDAEGNNVTNVSQLHILKNNFGTLGEILLINDEHFTTYTDFDGYSNNHVSKRIYLY